MIFLNISLNNKKYFFKYFFKDFYKKIFLDIFIFFLDIFIYIILKFDISFKNISMGITLFNFLFWVKKHYSIFIIPSMFFRFFITWVKKRLKTIKYIIFIKKVIYYIKSLNFHPKGNISDKHRRG